MSDFIEPTDRNLASDPNVRSARYLIASAMAPCGYCGAPTTLVALVVPAGHETLELDDDAASYDDLPGLETRDDEAPPVESPRVKSASSEASGVGSPHCEAPVLAALHSEAPGFAAPHPNSPTAITSPDAWNTSPASAFLFLIEDLPPDAQRRLHDLAPSYRLASPGDAAETYWANHCGHCGFAQDDYDLFCEPEGAFVPTSHEAARRIYLTAVDEAIEVTAAGYAYEPQFYEFMVRA